DKGLVYPLQGADGEWETIFPNLIGDDPWCVTGDFNAMMNKHDRIGATVRWAKMQPMANCMNGCGLEDMKGSRRFYTWSNKQEGDKRVFSKIDRAMCNPSWCTQFPNAETIFLPENMIDHTPMVIKVLPSPMGKKPFKFYKYWSLKPDFGSTVQQGMYIGDVQAAVQDAKVKLEECKNLLHKDPQNKDLIDKKCQANK
ncbi:Nesprin-2, partial [Bienertia sinuspersici]